MARLSWYARTGPRGKVNDTFPGTWIIIKDPLVIRDSGLHLTTTPNLWRVKKGYLLEEEYKEPFSNS
jgi:hypothetical protein